MDTHLNQAIQTLEFQKSRIENAIQIIKSISGASANPNNTSRISEEGRRRISEAAKARWARLRQQRKLNLVGRTPKKTNLRRLSPPVTQRMAKAS